MNDNVNSVNDANHPSDAGEVEVVDAVGSSGASRPSVIALLLLAAIVGAAGFARHRPDLDMPWDDTLASINGSYYMGRITKLWHRIGFDVMRGEPCLSALPDVGAGRPEFREPYHHHPPVFPWLLYLSTSKFGMTERGLRVVPIMFSALTAALLVFAFGRRLGLPAGGVAGVLFLTLPMTFFYGWMPNPESATLFFVVATIVFHEALRTRGFVGYLPVAVALFVATQMDWQGSFAAAAILFLELTRHRADRRFGRTLKMSLVVGVITAAVTLGVFAWWRGSLGLAIDKLVAVAGASAGEAEAGASWTMWFRHQAQFWGALFTWPPTVFAVAGLFWLPFRVVAYGDATARLLLAFLVPGVLNVALFPGHAFDHDFWWFYATPYVVGVPVLVFARLGTTENRRVALTLVMFALAAWGTWRILETRDDVATDDKRASAATINALVGKGDVLVRSGDFGTECFYFDAWVVDRVNTPQDLDVLVALLRSNKLGVKRLLFVHDTSDPSHAPDLLEAMERISGGNVRRQGPAAWILVE